MKEIAWYRIDTSVTKFSSLFPQKERLRLSPYLNGKLEILLSSLKEEVFAKRNFRREIKFSSKLPISRLLLWKGGRKTKLRKYHRGIESITLSLEEGPLWRGWPKMRKTGATKRNELPSKLSLEKGFFCVKLVVVLQTVRTENESLQTLPGKGFLRTKDGCMRKERAPSNSPWRGSFARENDWFFDKMMTRRSKLRI